MQELAFTLADAGVYVQRAVDAGLEVDGFAPRLSFFFNAQIGLFEEVAKFRAARRLWHRIMTEEFGAKDPKSSKMRFHTQTAGVSLTAQQAQNNIVRTTVEALAAVLGGTQSLHTNSFDEALGLPSEQAARVALRTQQILAEETGVADTIDPLAGSYFVESLTKALEEGARQVFREIEDRGGMVACVENGWVQEQIHRSAYAYQQEVEAGRATVVGVNKFKEDEPAPALFRVDPALEPAQQERLARVRKERDTDKAAAAVARLEQTARDHGNVMPPILEAVRARATVGEMADALRAVFGTYD